MLTNPDT